jgi:hypothetical protein
MLTSLYLGTQEEAVGHTRRHLDPAVHPKADERHAPRHYTGGDRDDGLHRVVGEGEVVEPESPADQEGAGREHSQGTPYNKRRLQKLGIVTGNVTADPAAVEKETPRGSITASGADASDEWAWVELNYRPHAYQACALTT